MVRAITAGLVALVVAAFVTWSGADRVVADAGTPLIPEMAGSWAGEARIAVNWTQARALPVRLTIDANGSVAGTVGDATLRDGRLESNRTAVGRALHIKTDWIVRGTLDGAIIKAEAIRRDGVMIPLNFDGGRFDGGVNTTGGHFGGKDSMWLAAGGLVLERQGR